MKKNENGLFGDHFRFQRHAFFDSDKQEESWEIISMRLRGRAFGKQEMQRRMHGRSGKSIFEYLLERDVPDDEVLRLMAEKEEIYRELCLKDRERFHLAPGSGRIAGIDQRASNPLVRSRRLRRSST